MARDLERATLSALLLSTSDRLMAFDKLTPSHFAEHDYRAVFVEMARQFGEGGFDDVTLLEAMKGTAREALQDLDPARTSSQLEEYIRLLDDERSCRSLGDLGQRIQRAVGEGASPAEIIEFVDAGLHELTRDTGDSEGPVEAAVACAAAVEQLKREQRGEKGIGTGLSALDEAIPRGLNGGDLVVLAGRPSMGKSSLALTIAHHVALVHGPVLLFSMEVSRAQVCRNLAHAAGSIDTYRPDLDRLRDELESVSMLPLHIDDSPAPSLRTIAFRARRLTRRLDVKLVIVDHIGLLRSDSRPENRTQEMAHYSRGLKCLARELSVPILALSQLNRSVESRRDKRPVMSDLRDSGSLEQDADIVLLLYREDYYHPERRDVCGKAEILVAKNRAGPTGRKDVRFQKQFLRFVD